MKKEQAQTTAMNNNGGHVSKLAQSVSKGLSDLMERLYQERLPMLQVLSYGLIPSHQLLPETASDKEASRPDDNYVWMKKAA